MRDWPSDRIALGGDYNPEQWPREVWHEDVALMQRAGVTFATVGVFSWSWLEPEPGRYEFGWLDEVLGLLHDGGIAVDLATGTASPPPWFSQHYPATLPVDVDGRTLWPGSRQTWCPSSPVFTEHAVALAEQMARRYADHPARGDVARLERVRVPQPALLLRHLRRRLPHVAASQVRGPGGLQRRVGHVVLEPAVHRLVAGAPSATQHRDREPDAVTRLRTLRFGHAARAVHGGARRAAQPLPRRAGHDELHDARPLQAARLPPVGARAGRRQHRPLPRRRSRRRRSRAGVRRRPDAGPGGRGALGPDGALHQRGELAAGQPGQGPGRAGAELARARGARRRHARVLPVAGLAGGRGEVPLGSRPARGRRHQGVPRGDRARRDLRPSRRGRRLAR